jgi:protease-4
MIAREVAKAKESGKKVVVSMGQYAASGGYFVSLNADRIVAQSTTITGSIGVFAGKLNTRDMWGKLGISFDHVETSENASFYSALENYGVDGRMKLDNMLDLYVCLIVFGLFGLWIYTNA